MSKTFAGPIDASSASTPGHRYSHAMEGSELDLRRLRYFLTLAEELHFGRAAQRAFIAQPALSRHIKRLEEQLGVELLTRSSRRVALTDAGHQLAEDARTLLTVADAARERVSRAGQDRRLTVGFFTGDLTLAPAMRMFAESRPDVAVDVRRIYWDDQVRGVLDGSIDLALVHVPIDDQGLNVEPLHTEPRFAILAPDHPLADRDSVSIAELGDDRVVLHQGASAAWEAFHNLDPRPDGRAARPGPLVTCLEEKLEVVAAGRAISFLPESAAAGVALEPQVVAVRVTDMPPTQVSIAWSAERESPLVLEFVDVARVCGRSAASTRD
jgi:DNA-binding transcriptional LysR family regulator